MLNVKILYVGKIVRKITIPVLGCFHGMGLGRR